MHDISNPTRYVGASKTESWTEHLRRFDRVTASDVALREHKLAFHTGDAPPKVTRWTVGGEGLEHLASGAYGESASSYQ